MIVQVPLLTCYSIHFDFMGGVRLSSLLFQDEGESGEEEEEEDGFFVPHGYLSEGEGEMSDGEEGVNRLDFNVSN